MKSTNSIGVTDYFGYAMIAVFFAAGLLTLAIVSISSNISTNNFFLFFVFPLIALVLSGASGILAVYFACVAAIYSTRE